MISALDYLKLNALKQIAILLATSGLAVGMSQLALGEVTLTYDEFKDVTTVKVIPETFIGDPPQLFTSESFKGKIPETPPSLVTFQVYAYGSRFAWLACQGIDIIADGKSVQTQSLNDQLVFMRVAQIEQISTEKAEFKIWTFLPFEEAKKIAQAKMVRYRLCNREDLIFQLTEPEQADFRKMVRILEFGSSSSPKQ